VLFNITGGTDLTLLELNEAARIIYEAVDPDAQIIFGSVKDERMDGEVRITVVATGFTGAASAPLEQEEHGFLSPGLPGMPEEVSFGSSSSRNSDEFLEPAILRRGRATSGA